MDERELIRRARAGDGSAERSLYEANVDRVYRLAYRMTGDTSMAEDLTQETFVRAFDQLGTFRQESRFSTWLHTIATHKILDGLRKRKRFRQRETELGDLDRSTPARGANPELKVRLENAIHGLSEILRVVFVMHDIEGYKHQEIADCLGIPEGTSKARLSRARASLREALAPVTVKQV